MNSSRGLCRFRDYEIDTGALGNCARPFHVQISFAFLAIGQDAGRRSIVNNVQLGSSRLSVGGQAKEVAKISYILRIDIGLTHDRNSFACAIDGGSCVPCRCDVIDGCEIVWTDAEAVVRLHAAAAGR